METWKSYETSIDWMVLVWGCGRIDNMRYDPLSQGHVDNVPVFVSWAWAVEHKIESMEPEWTACGKWAVEDGRWQVEGEGWVVPNEN